MRCASFLSHDCSTDACTMHSIRYHLLHPEYIHQRIADLGQNYNLRIILVQCDADNHVAAMKELTKIALVNGYTLMTCWRCVCPRECWRSLPRPFARSDRSRADTPRGSPVWSAGMKTDCITLTARKKPVATSRRTSSLSASRPT